MGPLIATCFGGPIAIALELAQGPIVYGLQKYDFLVLFPINPSTLAKYREAFTLSRAKDDPTEAELALVFKWIRILYRCWQARIPYDELIYLEALRRRGSLRDYGTILWCRPLPLP